MSLSHDEIARPSRMSIDELHVEAGRTSYADRLGKKIITGQHPPSYHVKTVTRGGQTRVLFDTRVPRPPGKEKLARITIFAFQVQEETLPEDLRGLELLQAGRAI